MEVTGQDYQLTQHKNIFVINQPKIIFLDKRCKVFLSASTEI
jgi:hypothetical protein